MGVEMEVVQEPSTVATARGGAGDRSDAESRTRATIALALAVLLMAAEIVLGVDAYCNIHDVDFAIALAGVGVVGFAIIDWFRPRRDEHGARHLRKFMPIWSLVPFLCALGSSVWVHYQQWEQGFRDIHEVAEELNRTPSIRSGGAITVEAIESTVAELARKRFPGDRLKLDEAQQFYELARVVGHDLMRAKGDPKEVVHKAHRDMTLDFCLTLGAQALFVLWIPLLLLISIARANRKLAVRAPSEHDRWAARAALKSARTVARSLRHSIDLRDQRILAEDRAFFIPRLCFGVLLVLGTTYVFAPFGLKASYIMSLVNDHALPGRTSFALWSNSFSAAPVMVVGFVGFLIYALITATQRFAQDDLDDQAIFALLVRGLIVILLSLALSSSPINDAAARMFVFIAGVFPLRALEAIAKRANVAIDPDFPSDGPGSFEGIPSLDPAKVFALRAAGIQSSYDLAAMPIEEIVGRVRIDPRLLGRAVDRAILIDAVGPKLTCELEPFAITSATELVAALPSMPECVTAKLGDAPRRAAERLATDARVDKIRQWLAGAQG